MRTLLGFRHRDYFLDVAVIRRRIAFPGRQSDGFRYGVHPWINQQGSGSPSGSSSRWGWSDVSKRTLATKRRERPLRASDRKSLQSLSLGTGTGRGRIAKFDLPPLRHSPPKGEAREGSSDMVVIKRTSHRISKRGTTNEGPRGGNPSHELDSGTPWAFVLFSPFRKGINPGVPRPEVGLPMAKLKPSSDKEATGRLIRATSRSTRTNDPLQSGRRGTSENGRGPSPNFTMIGDVDDASTSQRLSGCCPPARR